VIEILKRYKKSVVTFLIFVAYSAVMFWSYYDAQVKLEADVLNEIRLETEKQAAAISYFLAERRNDLADLAASHEVANFFVNRDLGMSYEYGLGISVLALESRLARLRAQKKLGTTPIYREVILADGDDRLVAPARADVAGSSYREGLRLMDRSAVTVSASADKRNIYFSAPVMLNSVYRGRVIAWTGVDIFSSLVAENGGHRLAPHVVTSDSLPELADGITASLSPTLRGSVEGLFAQDSSLAQAGDDGGDGRPVAVVRVPIGNSPLSLIAPVSGKHAGERSMEQLFLLTAGLVPLLVLILALRDIYERKRSEELQQAARLEAERLARLRSEFVANMSHEIRTPLNGVLGLAQIGYRNNVGRAQVLDTFARILDSGKLLLGIINDVLDFSKIEAGKLVVEKAPVDLGHLIDEVSWMQSERASAKGVTLRIEKAASLPASCLGDSVRLTQILSNLLSNAVKFTEKGQVILTVGSEDGQLRFTVADSGIGMSPEQLGRVFAPFEQADSSTTRKFGGTGLGLAITKRLVDLMEGTIRVESNPGSGTTFEVSLPYVPVAESAMVARSLPAPVTEGPHLSGIRILVAEDNDVNRLILDDMLSGEGARVTLVENGRLALDLVARDGGQAFDLVLMDIQMPEMDGYEATREILKLAPDLPIVAQTAHALSGEADRCQAVGMVDQLTKPVDCQKLVDIVLRNAKVAPIPPSQSATTTRVIDTVRAPVPANWMDWPALRERYAQNPEFLRKLLNVAITSLATMPADLREALRAEDSTRTIFLAHSVKGAAGNLLASELATRASEAELACRANTSEAGGLVADLADAVEDLLTEINEQLERGSVFPLNPVTGNPAPRQTPRRA
jgi:signal transduction histidine kinase/CheY-like chemotaxis protein